MKTVSTIISLIGLSLTACGPIDFGPNPPDFPSEDMRGEISSCPKLNADVLDDNDFVLPAESCWAVSNNFILEEDLVIKEGVRIEFEKGASLTIAQGGLTVAGTAEKPVYFTGSDKNPGFWRGLTFTSRNSTNALEHVVVEYAGNDKSAAVLVNGSLSMKSSTLSNNSHIAFASFSADAKLEFTGNTISNNRYVGNVHVNGVSGIEGNTYENNENESIFLTGDLFDDQTWSVGAPLQLTETLEIKANLTLSPGTKVKIEEGLSIWVNIDGSLNAEGTTNAPIVFSGTQDVAGFWNSIYFASRNSRNVLDHVKIMHGGGENDCVTHWDGAALCLAKGSKVQILNSEIKNSKNYAITTTDDVDIEGFSNNQFTENERVLNLHPQNVRQLSGDSTYQGNQKSYIVIRTIAYNGKLEQDGTWPANPIPYRVTGVVQIKSNIEIEAGAIFEFTENGRISVLVGGSLKAIGTQSNKIVFRGVDSISGFWVGLYFSSKSSNNILENIELSNAGSDDWGAFTGTGGIAVYGGLLTVNSSSFTNNKEAGIVIHNNGELNYCDLEFDKSGNEIDTSSWRGVAGKGGSAIKNCN